mmetsp:Transcript_16381/g.43283  ORF Transcript_16381/g.43283 Transcript_16381/m.43283 type:complete len:293 (-) Transcript_16381:246-1124(-)
MDICRQRPFADDDAFRRVEDAHYGLAVPQGDDVAVRQHAQRALDGGVGLLVQAPHGDQVARVEQGLFQLNNAASRCAHHHAPCLVWAEPLPRDAGAAHRQGRDDLWQALQVRPEPVAREAPLQARALRWRQRGRQVEAARIVLQRAHGHGLAVVAEQDHFAVLPEADKPDVVDRLPLDRRAQRRRLEADLELRGLVVDASQQPLRALGHGFHIEGLHEPHVDAEVVCDHYLGAIRRGGQRTGHERAVARPHHLELGALTKALQVVAHLVHQHELGEPALVRGHLRVHVSIRV